MKKKSMSGPKMVFALSLFLGSVTITKSIFFRTGDDELGRVLGVNSFGNSYGNDGLNAAHKGDDLPEVTPVEVLVTSSPEQNYVEPVTDVTGYQQSVYAPVVVMPNPNRVEPRVQSPAQQIQQQTVTTTTEATDNTAANIYRTVKAVELVSVSERSVTTNSNYVVPVVTTTVLKSIQNKFEQVGRGELLGSPKPTESPIKTNETLKRIEEGGKSDDTLVGNVDVFYKIIGDKVLLGAENSEGRQLQIKEEDLRSAEITMSKILDKKNLKLSMTRDNNFAFVQGEVVTISSMPVHVNIESSKLYLETPNGNKELKILPLAAIKEAVDLKSFEKLNKDSAPTVENFGDELAYKVVGDKTYKAFGLVNVVTKQNVYITAESGEVIEGEQPFFTRFVRLISI